MGIQQEAALAFARSVAVALETMLFENRGNLLKPALGVRRDGAKCGCKNENTREPARDPADHPAHNPMHGSGIESMAEARLGMKVGWDAHGEGVRQQRAWI